MMYAPLHQSWPQFSRSIAALMAELGLDKLNLPIDHTALRVNTVQAADSLRSEFEQRGKIISNNIINGRPILIIELDTPLRLNDNPIDCVELPYPGNKAYPQEGWEHVELVFNCNAEDCESLSQQLINVVPSLAAVIAGKTDITVKMSSPKGDKERLANPTIAFKKHGLCVKVHPHGIKAVIASET
ncbi:VOC family protein [Shewanella youngdeokensis]|uniref:VOC family protein n=1 Tax=Shewanella youngdeokensis TaxID=2999068 RepID=A0ABZ0K1M9_9GAMM|nr:VOC family protein [Shewanella sp. DAU334]